MFFYLHSSLETFQDNYKEISPATLKYPAVPHAVTDLCHCQFFISSPQVLSHGVNDLLLLLSGRCELLGSLVQGGDFPAIAFHVILQHLVPSREHSKASLPLPDPREAWTLLCASWFYASVCTNVPHSTTASAFDPTCTISFMFLHRIDSINV